MALLSTAERTAMQGAISGTFGDVLTHYTGTQAKSGNIRQAAQWTAGATFRGRLTAKTPVEAFQAWGEEVKEPSELRLLPADAERLHANDRLLSAGLWYRIVAVRPATGAGKLSGRVLLERVRSLEAS